MKIEELKNFVKKNLNENECVSVFNYLDSDKKGAVDRQTFIGEVRRFMNASSKKSGKPLQ
jgi:Ca2+-binding EF-hand superfamily protein